MLALVEPSGIQVHSELYHALLQVLPSQIATMEQSFLEVRTTSSSRTSFVLLPQRSPLQYCFLLFHYSLLPSYCLFFIVLLLTTYYLLGY
jgi:hypothetical protein